MMLNNFLNRLLITASILLFIGCSTLPSAPEVVKNAPAKAVLDLIQIHGDKVMVELYPGVLPGEEVTFQIPKIIPGTYSEDNYGQLVDDLMAYDVNGDSVAPIRRDINIWVIPNIPKIKKIQYFVNDTYDIPGEKGVFSPAGTNILEKENFMLNMHGFIGYFQGEQDRSYNIEILRPNNLLAATALELKESENISDSTTRDIFHASRYFQVIDNPIMYNTTEPSSFKIDDIEVLVSLYSPNAIFTVEDFKPALREMISAQKRFLGEIDNTSRYAILLYLADKNKTDAKGSGALEHHTSTVVVFPETMEKGILQQAMVDVVSHEFFHILTPLNIHSEEIHDFNYIEPKMSKHLWLYEGVTEYFAHLFQVNQGLISEEEFLRRLDDKILIASHYDETLPFTLMSSNILKEEYKHNFYNVYHKGALIAMALDIELRQLSNGETGLLDIMKQLSEKYGKNKPFEDEKLFQEITSLSYPEIGEFFSSYVEGRKPLPYPEIFKKVGLEVNTEEVVTSYFHKDRVPYVNIDVETGEIYFRKDIRLNSFLSDMGLEGGDVLEKVNGIPVNPETIGSIIKESVEWPINKPISFQITRNGVELTLAGKTSLPTETIFTVTGEKSSESKQAEQLRHDWLKG